MLFLSIQLASVPHPAVHAPEGIVSRFPTRQKQLHAEEAIKHTRGATLFPAKTTNFSRGAVLLKNNITQQYKVSIQPTEVFSIVFLLHLLS